MGLSDSDALYTKTPPTSRGRCHYSTTFAPFRAGSYAMESRQAMLWLAISDG